MIFFFQWNKQLILMEQIEIRLIDTGLYTFGNSSIFIFSSTVRHYRQLKADYISRVVRILTIQNRRENPSAEMYMKKIYN